MDVRFEDEDLVRAEAAGGTHPKLPVPLLKQFRKAMYRLRAAADERDLRGFKGLRFEKLKGDRAGQYSARVNQQMRLILEIEHREGGNVLVIKDLTDYHK